jgi:hypothetical protein
MKCYICKNDEAEVEKTRIFYIRNGDEDPTTVCTHHHGVKESKEEVEK